MERPLYHLRSLSQAHECPIIVAGDVLHHWWGCERNLTLLNWATKFLCEFDHGIFAIPGQHDMPNHNIASMGKSAFTTLVNSGAFLPLKGFSNVFPESEHIAVHAQPYGSPLPKPTPGMTNVLVSHRMVWNAKPYPDAPESGNVDAIAEECAGYDLLVFGDNHRGFHKSYTIGGKRMDVVNCGCLYRGTKEFEDYKPRCYLWMEDGTVEPSYFSTMEDEFDENAIDGTTAANDTKFLEFAAKLRDVETHVGLTFREMVLYLLERVDDTAVSALVMETMEKEGVL